MSRLPLLLQLPLAVGLSLAMPAAALAAQPAVGLGTATSFSVMAGTTVTNTGPSVISGDLGVAPGSAVSGFPPGLVINGTQHVADAVALQAQNDLTTAYNDAAGRTPVVDQTGQDLGGQTLVGGVYKAAAAMALTGTVTLDAQGDPNVVFIFQAGSTLITASSSTVALVGGAQACNVFWQVGSSATLGTATTFVGSILALTSATLQTGATVQGRVLARNGQVSLDTNTITRPGCVTSTQAPSVSPTVAPSTGSSPSTSPSAGSSPAGPPLPGSVGGPGNGNGNGNGNGANNGPGGSNGSGNNNGSVGNQGPGGPGGPGTPGTPTVPTGHPETGTLPRTRPSRAPGCCSAAWPWQALAVPRSWAVASGAPVASARGESPRGVRRSATARASVVRRCPAARDRGRRLLHVGGSPPAR